MSNHIHLIVSADGGFGIGDPEQQGFPKQQNSSGLQILNNKKETKKPNNTLSDIFRDMKKYTSKRIRESMNSLEVNESRREWMNTLFDEFG